MAVRLQRMPPPTVCVCVGVSDDCSKDQYRTGDEWEGAGALDEFLEPSANGIIAGSHDEQVEEKNCEATLER